jgi:hypothetical protein
VDVAVGELPDVRHYLLPVLAIVFHRRMRESLRRIKHMVEAEASEPPG